MTRTTNARGGVSLFAAVSVLALAGRGLSQRSAAVPRRTVSVGDLDTFYRDANPAYFDNTVVVVKRAISEATATTASWRSSPCIRKD